VRCRLGWLGPAQSKNLTWTGSSQLACYFEPAVHVQLPEHQCAEVSINGGRSYTSDCPGIGIVNSTRAPIATDFAPKYSLIADPATIIVSGVGFEPLMRYWCLFSGPEAIETR